MKEMDGAEGDAVAELQVSPHRNLVTPAGMRQIETAVESLRKALSSAREREDSPEVARIQRDLRYWTERLGTAEVVTAPVGSAAARFGSTVTLAMPDGGTARYQIVGEDEAEPAAGKISYVSPIARALIGRVAGERVAIVQGEAEIVEVA
jgi:transcription elongation GreA/GreB family factor